MTWEIVSREKVQELGGVSRKELRDEWYEWVADLIQDFMGVEYLGSTSAISEEAHDGTGTRILFVEYPPIVSVSEVKVGEVTPSVITSSSYKVYDDHIKLVENHNTEIAASLSGPLNVFPEGTQNILVSYTSGKATVPPKVELCAAMMIQMIAHYQSRDGAVAFTKYADPDVIQGVSPETMRMSGLDGQLMLTMQTLLDKKSGKLG